MSARITGFSPTVFFAERDGQLVQLVKATIESDETIADGSITVATGDRTSVHDLPELVPGEHVYEISVPEFTADGECRVTLKRQSAVLDSRAMEIEKQKHWEVHLIHYSHHDIGYTDMPSNVLDEYVGFYNDAVRFCRETDHLPEEARFKYTVEEFSTLQYFLDHAEPARVAELVEYAKQGRIEITALFGNQISELCSHEEIHRLLYPSFRFKKRHGVTISSAIHNDIPGVSWAYASALPAVGVHHLFMGIPVWYFGRKLIPGNLPTTQFEVHPLWDESRVVDLKTPGGVRWEGIGGSRLYLWYDVHGIGELYLWTCDQAEAEFAQRLSDLHERQYAYDVVRFTVRGGGRDNAPPLVEISHIVDEWNHRWKYPKLIFSTNDRFIHRFGERWESLPVVRGEIPNTDYTIGAISGAKETGLSRMTHSRLLLAEQLASFVPGELVRTGLHQSIEKAYTDTLYYDMHCLGLNHNLGPGHDGNRSEKNVFAYRAAATSHDVLVKGGAQVARDITLDRDGDHIVVFNPLSHSRTDLVTCPFYGEAPASTPMYWTASEPKGYAERLCGKGPEGSLHQLSADIANQAFRLIDIDSGSELPYQIHEITDPNEPTPFASERFALGHLKQEARFFLQFIADDIPPSGYRTYRLEPVEKRPEFITSLRISDTSIENAFYRVEINPETGAIAALVDKERNSNLEDTGAAYALNQLVVRDPRDGSVAVPSRVSIDVVSEGPVHAALRITGTVQGCPLVVQDIVLYDRLRRVDFRNRVLRDWSPLLELYFAFPFNVPDHRFAYESNAGVIEPVRDQVPGTATDYYAMQNWAAVYNDQFGISLSSVEAPIIEFGGLWPGYVSGAHHCVTPPEYGHPFLEDMAGTKPHAFVYVMNNNFRTNFHLSQPGEHLFQFSLSSFAGRLDTVAAHRFGFSVRHPLYAVPLQGPNGGSREPSASFASVDRDNVSILTVKIADSGNGTVVRLQELSGRDSTATLTLPTMRIARAFLASPAEEELEPLPSAPHSVRVEIPAHGTVTVGVE